MGRGIGRVGRPGLVGTVARTAVVAGTATAVAGGMQRHAAGRAEEQAEADAYRQQQEDAEMQARVDAAVAASSSPAAAPPAGDMDAKIAQLGKLAELKAQGILTEAEFATQKAVILGG